MHFRTPVLIPSIFLACLFVSVGCQPKNEKNQISDEDLVEAYTGTWINDEYNRPYMNPRIVFYADEKYEIYEKLNNKNFEYQYGFNVKEQWVDGDGNIFFKIMAENVNSINARPQTRLIKVNKSKKTLEMLLDDSQLDILEWDTDALDVVHRIYYQEQY